MSAADVIEGADRQDHRDASPRRDNCGRHPHRGSTRSGESSQHDAAPGADFSAQVWPLDPPPIERAGSLDEVLATTDDPWSKRSEDRLTTAQMDALLLELAELRRRIDRPISRIAALFVQERAWRALGHARQEDYARNRLESTGRWLRQTAALGEALARFPSLDAALTGTDGGTRLTKSAALQIAGIATDRDVDRWIVRAREVSLRQLTVDVQRAREDDALRTVPHHGATREHRGATPPWERAQSEAAQQPATRPQHSAEPKAGSPAEDGAQSAGGRQHGNGSSDGEAASSGGQAGPADQQGLEQEICPAVDVVIDCPPEVVAAFDEVLDLHRAVCGKEASIASFVEALAAEAGAGLEGPDQPSAETERDGWDDGVLRDPERRRRRPQHPKWMDETDPEIRARRCRAEQPDVAPIVEEIAALAADVIRLERDAEAASRWLARHLRRAGSGDPPEPASLRGPAGSGRASSRTHAGATNGGHRDDHADRPDAHALEGHIRRAGALDLALERAMARLLGALKRAKPWGLSGVIGIGAAIPDEGPTWAVSLGQYASERLGLSATRARELARVADRLRAFPILQASWTDGQLSTDKALALLPLLGDGPIAPELEQAWGQHAREITVRRLKDEVRELRGRHPKRRRTAPPPRPMADEEWRRSLRRQPGRTLGRVERLDEHLRDTPSRPRNVLRLVLPYDLGLSLLEALNAASARRTSSDSENRPEGGGAGWRWPQPYWRGLMELLLDYARTWDPPENEAGHQPRLAAIYERDGYRCSAPDCTSRAHLEVHHVRYRAQGGSDDPSNLVALCRFHHQQGVHKKTTLRIEGTAPLDLTYTLGKADRSRTYRNDRLAPSSNEDESGP